MSEEEELGGGSLSSLTASDDEITLHSSHSQKSFSAERDVSSQQDRKSASSVRQSWFENAPKPLPGPNESSTKASTTLLDSINTIMRRDHRTSGDSYDDEYEGNPHDSMYMRIKSDLRQIEDETARRRSQPPSDFRFTEDFVKKMKEMDRSWVVEELDESSADERTSIMTPTEDEDQEKQREKANNRPQMIDDGHEYDPRIDAMRKLDGMYQSKINKSVESIPKSKSQLLSHLRRIGEEEELEKHPKGEAERPTPGLLHGMIDGMIEDFQNISDYYEENNSGQDPEISEDDLVPHEDNSEVPTPDFETGIKDEEEAFYFDSNNSFLDQEGSEIALFKPPVSTVLTSGSPSIQTVYQIPKRKASIGKSSRGSNPRSSSRHADEHTLLERSTPSSSTTVASSERRVPIIKSPQLPPPPSRRRHASFASGGLPSSPSPHRRQESSESSVLTSDESEHETRGFSKSRLPRELFPVPPGPHSPSSASYASPLKSSLKRRRGSRRPSQGESRSTRFKVESDSEEDIVHTTEDRDDEDEPGYLQSVNRQRAEIFKEEAAEELDSLSEMVNFLDKSALSVLRSQLFGDRQAMMARRLSDSSFADMTQLRRRHQFYPEDPETMVVPSQKLVTDLNFLTRNTLVTAAMVGSRNNELKRTLDHYKKTLNKLWAEIHDQAIQDKDDINKDLHNNQIVIDELRNRLSEAEARVMPLEIEKDEYKEAMENLQNKIVRLQMEKQELEEEENGVVDFVGNIEVKSPLTMGLFNQITDLNLEIEMLRNQQDAVDKVSDIRNELERAESDRLILEEQLGKVEADYKNAWFKISQLENQAARDKLKIEELKSHNEKLFKENVQRDRDYEDLNVAFAKREIDYELTDADKMQKFKELTRKRIGVDNTDDEESRNVQENESLVRMLHGKQKEIRHFQRMFERGLQEHKSHQMVLQEKDNRIEVLQDFEEVARNRLAKLENDLQLMEQKAKDNAQERDFYYTRIQELEQHGTKRDIRDDKIEEMQKHIQKVRHDARILANECAKLREEKKEDMAFAESLNRLVLAKDQQMRDALQSLDKLEDEAKNGRKVADDARIREQELTLELENVYQQLIDNEEKKDKELDDLHQTYMAQLEQYGHVKGKTALLQEQEKKLEERLKSSFAALPGLFEALQKLPDLQRTVESISEQQERLNSKLEERHKPYIPDIEGIFEKLQRALDNRPDSEEGIEKILEKYQGTDRTLDELQKSIEELKLSSRRKEDLIEQNEELHANIKTFKLRNKDLQEQLEVSRTVLGTTNEELYGSREENNRLTEQFQELNNKLKKQAEDLYKQVVFLSEKYKHVDEKLKKTEHELELVKQERNVLKTFDSEENQRLKDQLKLSKADLDKAGRLNKILERDRKIAQEQLTKSTKSESDVKLLKQYGIEKELRREIKQLQGEIYQLKDLLEEKERMIQEYAFREQEKKRARSSTSTSFLNEVENTAKDGGMSSKSTAFVQPKPSLDVNHKPDFGREFGITSPRDTKSSLNDPSTDVKGKTVDREVDEISLVDLPALSEVQSNDNPRRTRSRVETEDKNLVSNRKAKDKERDRERHSKDRSGRSTSQPSASSASSSRNKGDRSRTRKPPDTGGFINKFMQSAAGVKRRN